VADVQAMAYDSVIDTQGLLKSALVTRLARGYRVGLDWRSSREPLRAFYDRTFRVPWGSHAVERNRRLAALALDYPVQGSPDYGIRAQPSSAAWLPPAPYAVLLHASSDARKLWPQSQWVELARRLADAGVASVLPWGSTEERRCADEVAERHPQVCVAPALGLGELAAVLSGACAAIGVDTGLTHLAAALRVPVVGVYGATDPGATGAYAELAVNLGRPGAFPVVDEVLAALAQLGVPSQRGVRMEA
jgi:heptosyltransferase-1